MDQVIYSGNNCFTVALDTLGCKLNQAETETLSTDLAALGCRIVTPQEKADLYILNTCTVTHVADRKCRHLLRMARRRNPQSRIVAIGCYAENIAPQKPVIEGVDLFIGNRDKDNIINILRDRGFLNIHRNEPVPSRYNRTRSFIKAQDGCNSFCTYCIVPLVRGREKSLPPQQILDAIRRRVSDGYQEIVLTGTEIGRYLSGQMNLSGLLKQILQETEIKRLRLSSLQPQEITADLIDLWKNPRLCRHFHLALQSGSNTVLKRMGRRYTVEEYAEAVKTIRSSLSEVSITTDIIVGFPGETEIEFQESFRFCQSMEFTRIHVFPYSPREGTRAAHMPGQVPPMIKKQRSDQMLELGIRSLQNYCGKFFNRTCEVLFEQTSGDEWSGYTDTYIKVYTMTSADLTNRILPVKLIDLRKDGVCGKVLSVDAPYGTKIRQME